MEDLSVKNTEKEYDIELRRQQLDAAAKEGQKYIIFVVALPLIGGILSENYDIRLITGPLLGFSLDGCPNCLDR